MKSKKLISLLCAASMAVTSFATMVTAQATASDVYTFEDGATTGWTIATGGSLATEEDNAGAYLRVSGGGGGNRAATFSIPSAAHLTDGYVIEFDSLIHGANGMGRTNQTTQISFSGANKASYTSAWNDKGNHTGIYTGSVIKYDVLPDYRAVGIILNDTRVAEADGAPDVIEGTNDVWLRTQAVVNGGTVTVTAINSAGEKVIDGESYTTDATALSTIDIECARGEIVSGDGGKDPGYVLLDNVHIYPGDPEELTNEGMHGEIEKVVNPPVPAVLPDGATAIASADFEDLNSGNPGDRVLGNSSMVSGDYTISTFDSEAHDTTKAEVKTYIYGEDNSATKYLEMIDGRFACAGRGPWVAPTTPITTAALSDDAVLHEAFALRLNAASDTATPALYLVDSNGAKTTDNRYMYVLGAITTSESLPSLLTNGKIITIPADTWVVVDFAVDKNGKYSISIDGEQQFELEPDNENHYRVTYDNSGDNKITVSQLPALAVAWDKGDTTPNNTVADIDDIVAYQEGEDIAMEEIPAVELPAGATSVGEAAFDDIKIGQGDSRVRVFPNTEPMSVAVNDLTMSAGTKDPSDSSTIAEIKAKAAVGNPSNKVLEMTEGKSASAARGPLVKLTTPATTEGLGADGALHETFALKLGKAADDSTPAIYFVDTQGKDGTYLNSDNRYMYVLGAVTTNPDESLMTNGGKVVVDADKWVVVDLALYNDGRYTISIDGKQEFELPISEKAYRLIYDNSGDNRITVSQLPGIVVSWDKSDSATHGTVATIDNFKAYTTGPVVDVWTKYVAEYNAETGVLTNVTVTPNYEPTAEDANPPEGTYIWNQFLKPYTAE